MPSAGDAEVLAEGLDFKASQPWDQASSSWLLGLDSLASVHRGSTCKSTQENSGFYAHLLYTFRDCKIIFRNITSMEKKYLTLTDMLYKTVFGTVLVFQKKKGIYFNTIAKARFH